jgi:glycosyltransferase involved in cell wall biosynthesis
LDKALLNKPKILMINTQFGSDVAKKWGLYGGVGYYRQRMPAKYLTEYTFNHVGGLLNNTKPEDLEKTVVELVKTHDLIYTKQLDKPNAIYMLLGACDYFDKPLILDFDDRVFTDDGLSPERFTYTEGTEMKHYIEVLMKEATAITVSTKPLQDLYSKYNTVHHLANSCDMNDWKWPLRHHDRLTVGWMGSGSHITDHPEIEEVYNKVIEKHPEVVFSFVGHMPPEHLKKVPRRNWEIKNAISWWEGNPNNDMTYPRLLAEQGYDIGLAPIIKSQFNEARSLVKWFEYTMTGIPLIASDFGPYTALRDAKDAYLVNDTDEWVDIIDYLLQNPNERKRLVENSRERIRKEFSIETAIPRWRKIFQDYIGKGFHRRTSS